MAETPQEPSFTRLGPVNWLPEERKVVERHEAEIRELRRRLEIAEAKAAYAAWKLDAMQAKRAYKVGEALTAKNPGGLVKAVRSRDKAPEPPPPVSEVIERVGKRGPEVTVPTVKWPDGPIVRPDLKVAVILDDFSRMAFRYEWDQIEFGQKNWPEIFAEKRPDLLFCESAWHGNQGRWRYQMTGTNAPKQELRDLVAWFNQEGIPTVFWNKEDPPNFEFFIETAKLFDYVFTCDGDMVPRYRQELGHDRIDVLQFAAQPRVHNPIQSREGRLHDVVFAGMYFRDKHPERREQMETVLAPVRELGLHIFARNGEVDEKYAWPEEYRPHIVGELPYEQMLAAYKLYKVFLNVNSVLDSPTMCARRVFELSACSTSVVSGWSRAIEETFGDLIPIAREPVEAYNLVLHLINSPELRARQGHLAMREVFDKHLFTHRVDQILQVLGHRVEPHSRPISVVLPTNRSAQIEHAISSVARQLHRPLQLVMVLHGLDIDPIVVADKARMAGITDVVVLPADKSLSLGACLNLGIAAAEGELIAKMDDDNLYGEHYLSDLARAFDYSEAELVGKGAHYTYFEGTNTTMLRLPGLEHRYAHLVQGGSFLGKAEMFRAYPFEDVTRGEDTRLVRRLKEDGVKIYSADRFNFVYWRSGDTSMHTWQADDIKLARNAQFSFVGRPDAHVMI
ncbi:spore maturation protein CgeB [Thermocatellispora tengchongensis]|uniref:Spore maturation protein CgeB n=1 Tax=Thermocatellispora tengchongensis TaxID=1073253 RepID=A0A840P4C5_9ACTN|nr:glycosyltransferase [Thermocatellispora tengchongensis]MBB5130895.1 spore maturation protein CgeB [Thermocatellispora tengchongensis]